ncbi:hypothetical protein V8E54_010457 [Elaphomyces granulatus]
MDNQRCTLKRKRSSTNVNGSSPVPENSLDGQTLPEINPFIEYGRATQEEEDPDADFEESIDKPEEILLFCHNKQQTSSLQTTYARPEEIIIDNMAYYLTSPLLESVG